MIPRSSSRPTLKDVAAAAHVSVSTVSYALNDASTVQLAAETRARIRRIAQEIGYTPNGLARSLQARSSRTVGVVVSKPLTSPRYAAIVQGAAREITDRGFRMAVLPDVTGESFLADCRAGLLDGLVFVGHDDVEVPPALREAAADGSAPLVVIDGGVPPEGAAWSSIDMDYAAGAAEMVRALAARGITRILHLRPEIASRAERERQAALMQVLGEVGTLSLRVVSTSLDEDQLLRAERAPAAEHPYLREQSARLAAALAEQTDPPERIAVLCSWGADAETALATVRTRAPGATVASLAGGTPRAELWPELLYSLLPLEEAGARAVDLLAAELRPDAPHEHLLLAPTLHPAAPTGPAADRTPQEG